MQQASNFTFDPEHGGFSEENLFSIDQRGFKTIILGEADEFLKPQQISLNSTVTDIKYSDSGVTVKLRDGKSISGDYALCTFSVGVLQNDDVKFQPKLPGALVGPKRGLFLTAFQIGNRRQYKP